MIEIVISIIILWLIALLTWQYLSTNIIILVAIITCVLVAYRLISYQSDKKSDKRTFNNTFTDLKNDLDKCLVYANENNIIEQYEIDRMLINEYKRHKSMRFFDGYTNKDILEHSFSLEKPLYKFKQPYVVTNIMMQQQILNNEQKVLMYYTIDDQDILVYTILGQQAKEIMARYDDVLGYGLSVTKGPKKYKIITNNGVMSIKKDQDPYEVELLVHYNEEESDDRSKL